MEDWSSRQYLKFESQRTRPVRDLLAAVHNTQVTRACDLGCGPGNSTAELIERFPKASVIGIDTSPDMIAAAQRRLPEVRFELADAATWRPEAAFDLLLSNAVLQWLPDHARLLPHLLSLLAPKGSLAVQMPVNLTERYQELMWQIAKGAPWEAKLAGARAMRTQYGTPEWYYSLLKPLCAQVDIWRTTYQHPLAGPEAVVEWFKSTGLRPYLAPLDDAEQADYLVRYRAAVAAAYPSLADGTLLLPFPRLFIVATV